MTGKIMSVFGLVSSLALSGCAHVEKVVSDPFTKQLAQATLVPALEVQISKIEAKVKGAELPDDVKKGLLEGIAFVREELEIARRWYVEGLGSREAAELAYDTAQGKLSEVFRELTLSKD